MNTYLEKILSQIESPTIDEGELLEFRAQVVKEMKKMGATKVQFSLLKDGVLKNAIRNNRKPEDVAWAILA